MEIMSLNAWGGKLHGQLLSYLTAAKADVICLQEITHSPEAAAEWLTYRDGQHVLAQRANLFRDLSDVLPEYVGIFCPVAQGVLWDGELDVHRMPVSELIDKLQHGFLGQALHTSAVLMALMKAGRIDVR